ncbi:angiopoietin-related protein 6-like [Anopheles bellator]|uniref:angiopoietin-related protein 6-like n=1 Tax=Anopheles bellator TaxID=139047 RepID=UPI00264940CE|nr:angiopoietin-related protein 6-like [Anopheles bellator]
MIPTKLLLVGAALALAVALQRAFSEPHHEDHHHHKKHKNHHKNQHHHHHHHHGGEVYGFGDPFESNARWLDEDSTCNCELIGQKLKRLREKVLIVLASFDKLGKAQVDLRQIKNLLKNIDLSLTTAGGSVSSSESQLGALEEQTSAISKELSRAKALALQSITKEYLVDALGPLKSSTDMPPLQELDEPVYGSCQDRRILKTGVYRIAINITKEMYVMCSLDFGHNAWTVIQNRYDGRENFFRPWNHYKQGFGYFGFGEYWLGLENIYTMTRGREYELLILLEDFDGAFAYAKYKYFRIEGEKYNYKLAKLHGYIGSAGNSLQSSDGMAFTTYDRDNDKLDKGNCAQENHGAWWFRSCGDSNLNGAYRKEYSHDQMGMYWKEFRGLNYSLKRSRIMIRSKKEYHHHHDDYHRTDEAESEEDDGAIIESEGEEDEENFQIEEEAWSALWDGFEEEELKK